MSVVVRHRRGFIAAVRLPVACAVLALACAGSESSGPARRVEVLELSQRTLTLGVGSSAPLEVIARDAGGQDLPVSGVFWSSSNPAVARVSTNGVVTAVAVGTAQIAATVQGKSAVAALTVAPTPAAAVRLAPGELRLTVGSQGDFDATVVDARGAALAGRVVQWRSSNPGVALVDSTGHVTAVAPGATSVTATSEGRAATGAVVVSAVAVATLRLTPATASLVEGQSTQLTAEPRDALGRPLAGRVVVWSSSAPEVATVSSAGLVVAGTPGSAVITASAEGKAASASITVAPRAVSSLVVSPAQLALTDGQSATLAVQVTDALGNVLSGRAVTFVSAAPGVATVSSSGVVNAVAPGTTTITVSSEGKTAIVGVTVTPVPVASIRVAPAEANVVVGETVRFTATPVDASGRALDRPVSWSSGAPTVATVAADGSVTGVSPGTAVILASTDGRVGSATVTVSAIPVARVEVTPESVTLDAGGTATLSARVRAEDGSVLTDRAVLWTSSDPAVATVSTTGLVTAVASGTATITASADGKSGSASITVNRPAPILVGRIVVSPATGTVNWNGPPANRRLQLSATAYTRDGAVIDDAVITWSSSDERVATVSSSGLVTAVKDGQVTITASSGTVFGTATITSEKR